MTGTPETPTADALPQAGGSYIRHPETGALSLVPPEAEATAPKSAKKPVKEA
jgi:hypothetical protein